MKFSLPGPVLAGAIILTGSLSASAQSTSAQDFMGAISETVAPVGRAGSAATCSGLFRALKFRIEESDPRRSQMETGETQLLLYGALLLSNQINIEFEPAADAVFEHAALVEGLFQERMSANRAENGQLLDPLILGTLDLCREIESLLAELRGQ